MSNDQNASLIFWMDSWRATLDGERALRKNRTSGAAQKRRKTPVQCRRREDKCL
jgi:hypothetical protein